MESILDKNLMKNLKNKEEIHIRERKITIQTTL